MTDSVTNDTPADVTADIPAPASSADDAARTSEGARFTRTVLWSLDTNGAARRALASGLRPWNGEPPAPMHRFVAPWLPEGLHPQRERAYYTVAALMTTARVNGIGSKTSLGTALALASRTVSATTTELALRRVSRYSSAGPYTHLRGVVRLSEAAGVALDWARLLNELDSWYLRGRHTCTVWLQDYYRITEAPTKAAFSNADSE
ncbi:type I-E CRISPR-associated protein Cse2/CasB [Kitasatospora sp. NPDC002040]|uniref:type I-E CRISPR-associated protein Cse2/CasB n=1 Tax=Kitasatospora sp. NPDC002040 TaxID=3154661 RepID=UPI003321511C